jgi:hypothetical protein
LSECRWAAEAAANEPRKQPLAPAALARLAARGEPHRWHSIPKKFGTPQPAGDRPQSPGAKALVPITLWNVQCVPVRANVYNGAP